MNLLDLTLQPREGTNHVSAPAEKVRHVRVYASSVKDTTDGGDLLTVYAIGDVQAKGARLGIRLTETQVRELRNGLNAWLRRNDPPRDEFRAARDPRP